MYWDTSEGINQTDKESGILFSIFFNFSPLALDEVCLKRRRRKKNDVKKSCKL